MSLYYGIDFGTSTNYITKWDTDKNKAVPVVTGLNGYGSVSNSFPNVIYYQLSGQPIIGAEAYEKYRNDPDNGVYAVKRHIGEDAWSVFIPNLNKKVTASDIAKDIFKCIKEKLSSQNAGTFIDGVVITVPYSYQNRERNIIRNSAEASGLHVIGLIEEPVAAALSFGLFNSEIEIGTKEKILIFDLGGGTFDVTIFEFIREPNGFKIEVLNTAGDKNLGGNDVDELLKNYFIDEILDISLEKRIPKFQNNVLKIAKQEKENLSDNDDDEVYEPEAYGDLDLECDIDRHLLEHLLKNGFLPKINDCLEETIYEIDDLEPEDIDKIVLVGGSSNIPIIRKELKKFFGKEPLSTGNPDELVGEGAGIFCGMKLNPRKLGLTVVPKISYAIGVKVGTSFEKLLPKNSKYQEYSDVKYLSFPGTTSKLAEVDIYQGNSGIIQNCCKSGTIQVDIGDFPENKIGIKLGTDSDGNIVYQLLDINGKTITQGKI